MPLQVVATDIPGAYHIGVYPEGTYCPMHAFAALAGHQHRDAHQAPGAACDPDCVLELFARVLSTLVALPGAHPPRAVRQAPPAQEMKAHTTRAVGAMLERTEER